MLSTRVIRPGFNNWLLFSATIEAFLALAGEQWDPMRVDYAVRQHGEWYKGDGVYGDGPQFTGTTTTASSFNPCCCRFSIPSPSIPTRGSHFSLMSSPALSATLSFRSASSAPKARFPSSVVPWHIASARFISWPISLCAGSFRRATAGAGSLRAHRRHPPRHRTARHLRLKRLADRRRLRASTRHC